MNRARNRSANASPVCLPETRYALCGLRIREVSGRLNSWSPSSRCIHCEVRRVERRRRDHRNFDRCVRASEVAADRVGAELFGIVQIPDGTTPPTPKGLAPQVGFEPTTLRLTAGCSTIELLRNRKRETLRGNAKCNGFRETRATAGERTWGRFSETHSKRSAPGALSTAHRARTTRCSERRITGGRWISEPTTPDAPFVTIRSSASMRAEPWRAAARKLRA
jgi:hypothetical protein